MGEKQKLLNQTELKKKNPGLHNNVIFCILIYTVELIIPILLVFSA